MQKNNTTCNIFYEGMLFAKWIRALNSLGLGIKFAMIRHQNPRENIIQFLIAESRRYLRAKNSHNLTLKKYKIPPSPQPAAKREAWARRRNTAYAMASTGSYAARGFEWTTQMAAAAGSPVYLYSTPRVQQLRCIPVL